MSTPDLTKQSFDGVSDETVNTVRQMFDKYDLDRDCMLNYSEFRQVLVKVGLRDVDAKAIYAKVDANRNGMVDMKEFIKWLFAEEPEFDTDKDSERMERMAKVHHHMRRGVMTNDQAMDDWFDFMTDVKSQNRFASTRNAVVSDKDLKQITKKDGTTVTEKNRDCKLKDLFNSMDLNSNGKLTMAEFVRGLDAFGHCGDEEMLARIFREIDQEKKLTRVWDKRYHEKKRQEDLLGEGNYLVPACEIFEMRDMRKWNEARAEAINELMAAEKESLSEARSNRAEKRKEQTLKEAEIAKLEDKINAKKESNPEEDRADYDALRDANRDLVAIVKSIDSLTNTINDARFSYTTTKHKDGLLDFKEFKKAFDALAGAKS